MALKTPDQFVVIIAVDPSEFSEFAFKWYVKHLHQPKHEVHMVYVQNDTPPCFPRAGKSPEKQLKACKNVGDNYLEWAELHGIKGAKFESPHGENEWHEIMSYAEKVGGDMIIIGCQSRGQMSPPHKILTGRISDKVLRHSPIPVLLCRAKPDKMS